MSKTFEELHPDVVIEVNAFFEAHPEKEKYYKYLSIGSQPMNELLEAWEYKNGTWRDITAIEKKRQEIAREKALLKAMEKRLK